MGGAAKLAVVEEREAVAVYRQGEQACVRVLLSLAAAVEGLQGQVAALESRLGGLEARLAQSSRNSSRPPSSDGFAKPPPKPRSRRRRSGRKPGGQPGSEGRHLAQVADPDLIVPHEPGVCEGCGGGLEQAEFLGVERRQVFDLPPETRLLVDEHRALRRRCGCCGRVTAGVFPASVRAPAQYGPRLRAFVLYLAVFQHLPYGRIRQLLADRYGACLSTGTLQAIVQAGAAGLEPFLAEVRAQLERSPVVHVDETGARAESRLQWVHEAATDRLALYRLHGKRGKEGIDALGVLPDFSGVAVHDGFTPYRRYGCTHALCNAHHLRELTAVDEQGGQPWASELHRLLVELERTVEDAKQEGQARLQPLLLDRYQRRYRSLVKAGLASNREPPPTGKRGRPAQGKTRSLLLRLDRYEDDVLRFAHDFRVPFDNNQGERDLRMIKLQQKISGCWRSSEGAAAFLALRSYTQTARKQGHNTLAALLAAAEGQPWLPAPAET